MPAKHAIAAAATTAAAGDSLSPADAAAGAAADGKIAKEPSRGLLITDPDLAAVAATAAVAHRPPMKHPKTAQLIAASKAMAARATATIIPEIESYQAGGSRDY